MYDEDQYTTGRPIPPPDMRIIQTLDDVERLIKIMKENGVSSIGLEGLHLNIDTGQGRYYPGGLPGAEIHKVDNPPKTLPPTDEELLQNPYTGMDNT